MPGLLIYSSGGKYDVLGVEVQEGKVGAYRMAILRPKIFMTSKPQTSRPHNLKTLLKHLLAIYNIYTFACLLYAATREVVDARVRVERGHFSDACGVVFDGS